MLKDNSDVLSRFIIKNDFSPGEVVVLEKNENSFLVPICKGATGEYFEKLFSPAGPFWKAYFDMGLAQMPVEKNYLLVLNGQLYFCKNIERKYFNSIGLKKEFALEKNLFGEIKVVEKIVISVDSFLRVLSLPFQIISVRKRILVDAFKVNEIFSSFQLVIDDSKAAVKNAEINSCLGPKEANYFLSRALDAMYYSFVASLAHALKLKPAMFLDPIIFKSLNFPQNIVKNTKETCFLTDNFYDISNPSLDKINKCEGIFSVNDPWLRLRFEAKLACARFLHAQRKSYLAIAKKYAMGEDIFQLTTDELFLLEKDASRIKAIALCKNNKLMLNKKMLPLKLIFGGEWFFEKNYLIGEQSSGLCGNSVGNKITVKGSASWIKNIGDIKKDFSGKIIVTDYFSPNIVVAFDGALGIISSVGGALSHPAIVSREKLLPCVIQVKGIYLIKENDVLELNGKDGGIKIITKIGV